MEPTAISMIVGALVAGSAAALKTTASQAVKDAYAGLKTLVIEHWKNKEGDTTALEQEAKVLLGSLEEDPNTFEARVVSKLTQVSQAPSQALTERAAGLLALLEKSGADISKYKVSVSGGQGVQIGDGGVQNNKF